MSYGDNVKQYLDKYLLTKQGYGISVTLVSVMLAAILGEQSKHPGSVAQTPLPSVLNSLYNPMCTVQSGGNFTQCVADDFSTQTIFRALGCGFFTQGKKAISSGLSQHFMSQCGRFDYLSANWINCFSSFSSGTTAQQINCYDQATFNPGNDHHVAIGVLVFFVSMLLGLSVYLAYENHQLKKDEASQHLTDDDGSHATYTPT